MKGQDTTHPCVNVRLVTVLRVARPAHAIERRRVDQQQPDTMVLHNLSVQEGLASAEKAHARCETSIK
jgi:hypothetical protein